MILKLKYFGRVAEVLGTEAEELELPVTEVSGVVKYFDSKLNNTSFKVAVNQSLVEKGHQLNEYDEVALLPPFAGG